MNDLKMGIWPLVLSSRGADCISVCHNQLFLLEICMSTRNQLMNDLKIGIWPLVLSSQQVLCFCMPNLHVLTSTN